MQTNASPLALKPGVSQIYLKDQPVWRSEGLKTEQNFGFGLCGPALQQEMAGFEPPCKDPELHMGESSDRSLALCCKVFR